MNDKIIQAIRETLPSIQTEEFKNFFENYKNMEKEFNGAKKLNENYEEKIEKLEKEDRNNYNLSEREKDLEIKIDKFQEEERNVKIKELEYKLDTEKN